MGDGEKLLTYLNSALKALFGFDISPRVPKKSEILLPSVIGYGYKVSLSCPGDDFFNAEIAEWTEQGTCSSPRVPPSAF